MVKVIKHNMGGINNVDDPTLPWRLEATLRVPEFMNVAALFLYGNEHVIIRADTEAELTSAAESVGITNDHPRMISLVIENTA